MEAASFTLYYNMLKDRTETSGYDSPVNVEADIDNERNGTADDRADMSRMGKAQDLRVHV